MRTHSKSYAGQKFGRLTVTGWSEIKQGSNYTLACVCDCGKHKNLVPRALLSGHTKSCGCLNSDLTAKRNFKHGYNGTPTYGTWRSMVQRCTKTYHHGYYKYGARGISVCARWLDFRNFLSDMGERPKGKTIERKNNLGNYEPGNCIWATAEIQSRNKRSNVFLTLKGDRKILSDWAKCLGWRPEMISNRIKRGWTVEEALTIGRL